jgi:putative transposase
MTWRKAGFGFSAKILAMIVSLRHFLGWLVSVFRSREDLVLENLASPSPIAGSARATTSPSIDCPAPAVLGCVENVLVRWRKPLVLVTPRTVVHWHRAGFRLYGSWISRVRQVEGRKRVSKVRALIFRMVAELGGYRSRQPFLLPPL